MRFPSEPVGSSSNMPFTHRGTASQWVFLGTVAVFAGYILWDAQNYNQLTGLYPSVAAWATVAFLIPLAIIMATKREPSPAFYDAERGIDAAGSDRPSSEYFVALLIGMLAISAVTGFVLGIAIFIFLFLWRCGQVRPLYAAGGAAAFVTFLAILSDQLTLRYPTGLLKAWTEII